MRDKGKVLKVDMPISMYKRFVDNAFDLYGGHYWYKIAVEGMMYEKLMDTQPIYIQEEILAVKDELMALIESKYYELKEYKQRYGELK